MMLSVHEHATLEDASGELLRFILHPANWVCLERLPEQPLARPGHNPNYQRKVGKLRICASVDVTASLDVFLRVAFQAPGLGLLKAAECLDRFLRLRVPLLPNSEWQVRVDQRKWIHFIRRYTAPALTA
jgi:hypothetical protein